MFFIYFYLFLFKYLKIHFIFCFSYGIISWYWKITVKCKMEKLEYYEDLYFMTPFNSFISEIS